MHLSRCARTKGDAIERIFKESNRAVYTRGDLFTEIKRRGHPVANEASLVQTLSKDAWFTPAGHGKWSLAQPDLSAVNGREKGAAS